ncbi:MAG: response regulator [Deltaproteobacteria bacterium]|nr:response regulator [Deltaproteobacteria bacterium]MBN2672237.1 response regulator [Deltaproteobacteria bacterium]
MTISLYRALIIDDEPPARKEMRFLLKDQVDFVVEWEAGSVSEAQKILSSCTPDVVFLDIHLRGGTGFDLISHIREDTDVVFVTAYDAYAVRAFEVNALDYLTKPVSPARLDSTLNRLRRKSGTFDIPVPMSSEKYREDDKILMVTTIGRVFIDCHKIRSITAAGGNYISVRLISDTEYLVRGTVKDWETKLPHQRFLRIHRNAIVNNTQLRSLTRLAPRKYAVMLHNDDTPYNISRNLISYVEQLLTATPG